METECDKCRGDLALLFAVSVLWLIAASISAVLLGLLLAIYESNQTVQSELSGDLFLQWPFCSEPLKGHSGLWVASTSLVYWVMGLALFIRYLRQHADITGSFSATTLSLAAGLLIFCVPMFLTIWALAVAGNEIWVLTSDMAREGNHGPWRQSCTLRFLLSGTLQIPVLALVASALNLLMRPSWAAMALIVMSVATFVALFDTHYWLID